MGTPSLTTILIVSNWSPTSATNIFSNGLFYWWRHFSFPAMHCLSHSFSFCLSAVLLSPRIICFDIKTLWCITSLSLNKLISELFSFKRLHPYNIILILMHTYAMYDQRIRSVFLFYRLVSKCCAGDEIFNVQNNSCQPGVSFIKLFSA